MVKIYLISLKGLAAPGETWVQGKPT